MLIFFRKRLFRCNSPSLCEEWVSAIRSAIKVHTTSVLQYKSTDHDVDDNVRKTMIRRATLSNIRSIFDSEENEDGNDKNEFEQPEVTVTMIALKSEVRGSEIVVARSVAWGDSVEELLIIY